MWLAIRTSVLLCGCFVSTVRTVHGQGVAWQKAIQTSEDVQQDGRLREAEQVLLDVLRNEALPGPEGLAYIYNNLGSICQDQGRFLDANRYYRRSVAEWERAGDLHRMALAITLNNLASLLWGTGKLGEAARVLERSSNIRICVGGSNHPEAALLFYNLGMLHLSQKRWAEAEVAYRQFLSIHNQPAGDRLETAVAANNLAVIYRKTGRDVDADFLFRRARLIWERFHDANVVSPALLIDLAASFWSGNRQTEAESAVIQALAAVESRLGANHARVAQTLTLYADILRRTHRKTQAQVMEKRAREIRTGDAQLRLSKQTVDISELARRAN